MTWRSEKYKKFVRSQPCQMAWHSRCSGDVSPHHIKSVGGFSGVGMTAPDILTMPLCLYHHNLMQENREFLKLDQYEYIVRTVLAAVNAGVLIVK